MNKQKLFSFLVLNAFWIPVSAQQYCSLGSEDWRAGCQASCTAGWEGSDCPKSCTATAPAGFVIMDHRVLVNSVNNGGHDVSRMAAGQSFDYKKRVEQAYSYAVDAAGKAGDYQAEAKIKNDMKNAIQEAESFNSSHQMVRLNVNASKHGNQYTDRKRGWSDVVVEIKVKCVVPQNLEQQLFSKYSLN